MAGPNKDELLAQAKERGIDVPDDATKADIQALLDDGQPQDQGADVPTPTSADLGQDQGFIGEKVDPLPNEAYSQETDPTQSPSAAESHALSAQRAADAARQGLDGDDGGGE